MEKKPNGKGKGENDEKPYFKTARTKTFWRRHKPEREEQKNVKTKAGIPIGGNYAVGGLRRKLRGGGGGPW